MPSKKPPSREELDKLPVKQLTMLQRLERVGRQKKLQKFSKESYSWFQKKAGGVSRAAAKEELQGARGLQKRTKPQPGRLYTYLYDPKHKKTLPYYDTFPMTFLIDTSGKYFTGLNIHYLPPKLRAVLLDALLEKANWSDVKKPENLKLKLSYAILKAASNMSLFKPCFKKYLKSHVRSSFVEIPATQWEIAIFLPTAQFEKEKNSKVWSDSSKYQ